MVHSILCTAPSATTLCINNGRKKIVATKLGDLYHHTTLCSWKIQQSNHSLVCERYHVINSTCKVTHLADVFVNDKDMWTDSRKVEHDDDEMVEMMMEFSKADQALEQLLFAA